jgi:uncharacterized membrane protein YfcA
MALIFSFLAVGVVVGTIFQRVTGMGFALLMAPFFAIVFGPYEGILLMNFAGAASSLIVLFRVWRDVDWKKFATMASAALPSGFLAGLLVTRLEPVSLQIMVGVVLILGLSVSLFVTFPEAKSGGPGLAFAAGAVSGFTNAAAGTGGPPIGIYAQATGWEQKHFAATLQPTFFVMGVSAFASKTIIAGELPALDWWLYVAVLVCIPIGLALGEKVKKRVNEDAARLIVIVLCYLGALSAIADGVVTLVSG